MNDEVEQMALDYFHSLSDGPKRKLMKKLVASLSDAEKVELAKMILKK